MRVHALVAALGLLVIISACAADGPVTPTPTASGTSTSGTPAATPAEELTITADNGSGAVSRWQLTCNPPGGTHPDPARACQVLETVGDSALPPVPKGTMCTQVYGGPETATITGTWRGRQINSQFSRTNGCEISRWNALTGVLPAR